MRSPAAIRSFILPRVVIPDLKVKMNQNHHSYPPMAE
jgi:hypothetical protein